MLSAFCKNQLNSNIKLKNSIVQFFWRRFGALRVTWIEETPIMLMYHLANELLPCACVIAGFCRKTRVLSSYLLMMVLKPLKEMARIKKAEQSTNLARIRMSRIRSIGGIS